MPDMKEILLEVVTPSKLAWSGSISSITVPGTSGQFQVLYNHAPLISSFEVGVVVIVTASGEKMEFASGGGIVEVLGNKILVLADSFESPVDIDIKRAEKAAERAKERLHNKTASIDIVRAEISLARAVNRLKVASMK